MTTSPTGTYTIQDWEAAKKTERRIRKSIQKLRKTNPQNLPPGFVPKPSNP